MNQEMHEEHRMYEIAKNRFIILIIGSILIALGLVMIALALYGWSGAAQVDLSRPGYSAVRTQLNESKDNSPAFSSNGAIDKTTLAEFEKLYDAAAHQVTANKVFEEGVLSDENLRIEE